MQQHRQKPNEKVKTDVIRQFAIHHLYSCNRIESELKMLPDVNYAMILKYETSRKKIFIEMQRQHCKT